MYAVYHNVALFLILQSRYISCKKQQHSFLLTSLYSYITFVLCCCHFFSSCDMRCLNKSVKEAKHFTHLFFPSNVFFPKESRINIWSCLGWGVFIKTVKIKRYCASQLIRRQGHEYGCHRQVSGIFKFL